MRFFNYVLLAVVSSTAVPAWAGDSDPSETRVLEGPIEIYICNSEPCP